MGTLMGHILPGTFFAVFAIWWGFCLAIKHFYARHSQNKTRKPIPYRSSTTYPCACCASSLRTVPIESYLKIICVCIGITGEAVTGLKSSYDVIAKRNIWHFEDSNAQHIAMFFSFGFAAFIEVLVLAKYNLPKGIEFIANIIAFSIEGLLFHFHLHGRNDVDIHTHTLLIYNISFCVLASVWEYNRPNQILASYCRSVATLLQGAWFYAAGFILYFPSNDPYWTWPVDHRSILIITVIFIWLGIFCAVFFLLQSMLVWKILKRRYGDLIEYSVLSNDDDDTNEMIHRNKNGKSNNHQLKLYNTNNENTIVQVNNLDDNDDSDSQVEFEQTNFTSKI